jgi:hypothetical protein
VLAALAICSNGRAATARRGRGSPYPRPRRTTRVLARNWHPDGGDNQLCRTGDLLRIPADFDAPLVGGLTLLGKIRDVIWDGVPVVGPCGNLLSQAIVTRGTLINPDSIKCEDDPASARRTSTMNSASTEHAASPLRRAR